MEKKKTKGKDCKGKFFQIHKLLVATHTNSYFLLRDDKDVEKANQLANSFFSFLKRGENPKEAFARLKTINSNKNPNKGRIQLEEELKKPNNLNSRLYNSRAAHIRNLVKKHSPLRNETNFGQEEEEEKEKLENSSLCLYKNILMLYGFLNNSKQYNFSQLLESLKEVYNEINNPNLWNQGPDIIEIIKVQIQFLKEKIQKIISSQDKFISYSIIKYDINSLMENIKKIKQNDFHWIGATKADFFKNVNQEHSQISFPHISTSILSIWLEIFRLINSDSNLLNDQLIKNNKFISDMSDFIIDPSNNVDLIRKIKGIFVSFFSIIYPLNFIIVEENHKKEKLVNIYLATLEAINHKNHISLDQKHNLIDYILDCLMAIKKSFEKIIYQALKNRYEKFLKI